MHAFAPIMIAVLAAIGFAGSSLIAVFGREMTVTARSYVIAIAAGILLALAFGDLFPESLDMAGHIAVVGFIGGYALLFLIESFTSAHTHHAPREHVHVHSMLPFIAGLALHNLADGFTVGMSGRLSEATALIVGLGVLIHQ